MMAETIEARLAMVSEMLKRARIELVDVVQELRETASEGDNERLGS